MTTTHSVRQFKILESKYPWLQGEIAKLAKRANKLGVQPLEVWIIGSSFKEADETGNLNVYLNVEIMGEAPVVPGWALVAIINVIEGEGIIKALPGVQLPEQFNKLDAQWCDHCKTRRLRNDTFILQNDDGVTFRQVGRQCLKDFIPGKHVSPDALAWFANAIDVALNAAKQAGIRGPASGPHYQDLQGFLSYVALDIRKFGWVSRKDAFEQDKVATADDAMQAFLHGAFSPTLSDVQAADRAIEWAAGLSDNRTDSNEFLHNVRTLARLGVVDHRTYRIAAAMIVAAQRDAVQNILKRVDQRGYVGAVGQPIEVKATVVAEPFTFTGPYGTSHIYKFSVNGDLAVWYSKELKADLQPHHTVTLRAKVKTHEVYRPKSGRGESTPQTVITHVTIV